MKVFANGQRGLAAIVLVGLMILGAVLGNPGGFPIILGHELTPDALMKLILPVLLGFGTLAGLFGAINSRVMTQSINPNDLKALLGMNEFWVALVGTLVAVAQMAGLHILDDPERQTWLLTLLQGGALMLLRTWQDRPPGQPDTLVTSMLSTSQVARSIKKE